MSLECPNKHKNRLDIWRELANFRHPPLARAILFPGGARHELDVVFGKGYRPENLYLVEYKPAVWANLTRRSVGKPMPPKENQLHRMLSLAGAELATRGVRLDVAHLDFCSNVEGHRLLTSELLKFLKAGVMAPESLLAVSWLRGREHNVEDIEADGYTFGLSNGRTSEAGQLFLRMTAVDRGRVRPIHRSVYEALGVEIGVLRFGAYQNTKTRNPMLWAIFHLVQKKIEPSSAPTPMRSLSRQWIPEQLRQT